MRRDGRSIRRSARIPQPAASTFRNSIRRQQQRTWRSCDCATRPPARASRCSLRLLPMPSRGGPPLFLCSLARALGALRLGACADSPIIGETGVTGSRPGPRPRRDGGSPMGLQQLLDDLLGRDLPVAVECYDGSRVGPLDAPATVRIVSPDAIHRIVTGRGRELSFARAYVAGEIDIEGDIFAVIALRDRVAKPTVNLPMLRNAAAQIGISNLRTLARLRPPEPPPEEVHLHGRLH